jgi:uncharacterized protein
MVWIMKERQRMTDIDVRHNEKKHRFETEIDGRTAYSEYEMDDDGIMVFTHTIVPEELEGRGIASGIVKHALDHARESGIAIVPDCPYVASWIERHPDYADLVPPEYR